MLRTGSVPLIAYQHDNVSALLRVNITSAPFSLSRLGGEVCVVSHIAVQTMRSHLSALSSSSSGYLLEPGRIWRVRSDAARCNSF